MLLLLDAYAPPAPRYSGGKLIASYYVGNDGRIKKEISKYIEIEKQQQKEDDELAAAILTWWRKKG